MSMRRTAVLGSSIMLAMASAHAAGAPVADAVPWWVWPLALFVVCFLLGIVAVPAGIGGGTLFVPIVGSFFPFHLDFVPTIVGDPSPEPSSMVLGCLGLVVVGGVVVRARRRNAGLLKAAF